MSPLDLSEALLDLAYAKFMTSQPLPPPAAAGDEVTERGKRQDDKVAESDGQDAETAVLARLLHGDGGSSLDELDNYGIEAHTRALRWVKRRLHGHLHCVTQAQSGLHRLEEAHFARRMAFLSREGEKEAAEEERRTARAGAAPRQGGALGLALRLLLASRRECELLSGLLDRVILELVIACPARAVASASLARFVGLMVSNHAAGDDEYPECCSFLVATQEVRSAIGELAADAARDGAHSAPPERRAE